MAMLRFEPGFSDPNWCERSHVLFVTHGELAVELEEQTVTLGAGQALWLAPGTRHRVAVVGGQAALLLAVSDVQRRQLAAAGDEAYSPSSGDR